MPAEGPVHSQLPVFIMPGPQIHPSRLQQMSPGNGASFRPNPTMYGLPVSPDDASSIAHTINSPHGIGNHLHYSSNPT